MSDKNIHDIFAYINNKYKSTGYLDNYGGSVLITILTLLIMGLIAAYIYFTANIKMLQKNWNTEKCKPWIIPFAGSINPTPGKSNMDIVKENAELCVSEILKKVVHVETAGIRATQSTMNKAVGAISTSINKSGELMSSIRNMNVNVFSGVYSKLYNVLIPLRVMLIKSLDSANKVTGVAIAGLYTAIAGTLSINSFFFLFLLACIFILVLVAGLIVAQAVAGFVLMPIPFVGMLMAIPNFILVLATTGFLIAIVTLFVPMISVITEVVQLTHKVPQHHRRLSQLHSKTKEYQMVG